MRDDEDSEFIDRLKRVLGDDYTIDRLIGQGGFGRVYAGVDVRLGRNVAVKVIRPDLAGARAFLDRFRNEGTALAKFRHPGIVPIYDIRESDGLIYYVMPLIDGETLRAKLDKRGKLSPKETQRILIEVCECLVATHRAGIVHRDIKPDNVILEGSALGKALLMDFGIAKSMRDLEASGSGLMMGTPTYMSPEQVSDGDVDHRSDLYSMGVMGYQMLTGRPPFQGASAHAVLAGHVVDKPVPIRQQNPSVPLGMAEAIERCLEKSPSARFESAAELSAALQSVVFASDADYPEPSPPNYAMPFFAGLSVECAAFAALGIRPLIDVTSTELWWAAGAFALLAVMLSPVARAATEPLNDEFRVWLRKRLRRG